MSDIFIPEKIKVGFQKREGTYTGKLAYVIYYDAKGQLRKEKSWEQWRDKKIEPEEFDNKPQDGFHLNKGIQRFNWGHFGSNRSYIRAYDSRGIEFEITPENLVGILTETDCSRRGLSGEFVYAWKGTELVLLPCCSQEYKDAQKYTSLQAQTISAKDLRPGCSYTTKKGDEVIYIGRFNWFDFDFWGYNDKPVQKPVGKKHVFVEPQKGGKRRFVPKNDATFLAVINSPDPVDNYATMVDEWNANSHSSFVEKWDINPIKLDADKVFVLEKTRWENQMQVKHKSYTHVDGDNIIFFTLCTVYLDWAATEPSGFVLMKDGTLIRSTMIYQPHVDNSHYSRYSAHNGFVTDGRKSHTRYEIMEQLKKFSHVSAILKSGKKIKITRLSDLNHSDNNYDY